MVNTSPLIRVNSSDISKASPLLKNVYEICLLPTYLTKIDKMVTVLKNTLEPQSQQHPGESPLDHAPDTPTQTPATPTPLSEGPDKDVKTEIFVPRDHVSGSRSAIIPLRILIPRNPLAVKPPQLDRSGIVLSPFVPALAEVKFKQNMAQTHTLEPEVEIIDGNGDLILNFVCTPEPWNDIKKTKPFLRLRISSAVVQEASSILTLLIEINIPDGEQQSSISLQPPRLHGLLTKTDHKSRYLIISNDDVRSNAADALRILFHILHGKVDDLPLSPKPVLVARVAEVAWLLGCVGSVVPWIRSRLLQLLDPKPSVELSKELTDQVRVCEG